MSRQATTLEFRDVKWLFYSHWNVMVYYCDLRVCYQGWIYKLFVKFDRFFTVFPYLVNEWQPTYHFVPEISIITSTHCFLWFIATVTEFINYQVSSFFVILPHSVDGWKCTCDFVPEFKNKVIVAKSSRFSTETSQLNLQTIRQILSFCTVLPHFVDRRK